ncbi:uncharacterized protein LOC116337742 [Contarinia nasturtii]|uniref:uncharacterized protein LOC116337742 n=1 Tax=Contarinia nasturtii TaxID=265458 RepID=UPI0012D400C8|nr:uncharacterized protein LOC116337742 [Contarinia nasturtii]
MLKSFNIIAKRFLQTSAVNLKGHAKWQNIKHIKAANDKIRSMMITRQLRLLRIAANDGGSPVPETNPMLRDAVAEAIRRDVPKTTIQNFLKKLSEIKDKPIQRYLYEGRMYKKLYVVISMFPNSVGLAKIQIATVFRKHLVEAINAKRVFNERGVINVTARDGISLEHIEDECLSDAIECGAEDIEVYNAAERQVSFFCDPNEFLKVRQKLSALGHKVEHSECEFFPKTQLVQLKESELNDYKNFKSKLIEFDGFDEIYDNLDDDNDENA